MPLVAEVIDAVIGGDTHRDTHVLEITAPTGATISTIAIDNPPAGVPPTPSRAREDLLSKMLVGGM